jgi:hypothetical protein
MLLYDYFNAAILNVRELRNGVNKLQRIDNETKQDHNKRRADYLFMQEQMKRNGKRIKGSIMALVSQSDLEARLGRPLTAEEATAFTSINAAHQAYIENLSDLM